MEVLPAGKYQVRLVDMDITVVGHMSGKMKLNKITVME
jgi:translation initiation factor IF-1